jgi:hypothetical protein
MTTKTTRRLIFLLFVIIGLVSSQSSSSSFPAYQVYYTYKDGMCSGAPWLIGAFPTQCIPWNASPGRVEYDRATASCTSKTSSVRFSTGCRNSSCVGCDYVDTLSSACTLTFPNRYNIINTCNLDAVKIPSDLSFDSYYDDKCTTRQMTWNQSVGLFDDAYVYTCDKTAGTVTTRATATGGIYTVKLGDCVLDFTTNTYRKYTRCNSFSSSGNTPQIAVSVHAAIIAILFFYILCIL